MITKEQKRKYLRDPEHCPFCDSNSIQAGEFEDLGFGEVSRRVSCGDCWGSWHELFTIRDIEDCGSVKEG